MKLFNKEKEKVRDNGYVDIIRKQLPFGTLALTLVLGKWCVVIEGENKEEEKTKVIIHTEGKSGEVIFEDVIETFNQYVILFQEAYHPSTPRSTFKSERQTTDG